MQAALGSQPRFGDLAVGIMRTLGRGDGRGFAVLRLRAPGFADQVELSVGGSVEVPGHGRLTVENVLPATLQHTGWVRLSFVPVDGCSRP